MKLTFRKFIFSLLMATIALVAFASNPKPPPKAKSEQGYSAPQDAQHCNDFSAWAIAPFGGFQYAPVFAVVKSPNYISITFKAVNVSPLRKSEGRLCRWSNFKLGKSERRNIVGYNVAYNDAELKVGWQKLILAA